jgi:hypothetical protein
LVSDSGRCHTAGPRQEGTEVLTFLMTMEQAIIGKVQRELEHEDFLGRDGEFYILYRCHIEVQQGQSIYWTHKLVFRVNCITCLSCDNRPTVVQKQQRRPHVTCTHCDFGNMTQYVASNLRGDFVLIYTSYLSWHICSGSHGTAWWTSQFPSQGFLS